MKKELLFVAIAVLSLTACSHDSEEIVTEDVSNSVPLQVTAEIESNQTRSDADAASDATEKWVDNAAIVLNAIDGAKIIHNDATYRYNYGKSAFDISSNGFYFSSSEEYVTIGAFAYNRDEVPTISTIDGTKMVYLKVSNGSFSDLLYASAKTSRNNPTINLNFKHVFSKVKITLSSSGVDEKLKDVTVTGFINTVGVDLNGKIYKGQYATEQASLYLSDYDTKATREFLVCQYQSNNGLNVLVTTESGKSYTAPITFSELAGGTSYTYNLTLTKAGLEINSPTITDWSEGTSTDLDVPFSDNVPYISE